MSLDPYQNRLANEATAAASDPANVPLNPPFPFTVVPFNPADFGLNVTPKLDTPAPSTP